MKNVLKVLFLATFLSSCSYFKNSVELKEYIIINSNPNAAEIYSESGELLGVTPLKLVEEKLKVIQKNQIITFTIKKRNFLERQLVFKNEGVSEINVNLKKMDEVAYKELIRGPLSGNINDILKKMIQVQEGIITKKYNSSEDLLTQLKNDYPNIASFYVMGAAIDIQNKRYDQAKVSLEKSLLLDETNELAKSYLNFINQRLKNE
jgi:tetratricopeptide (TPR) repeat protein